MRTSANGAVLDSKQHQARQIVLVTSDRDWLQFLERPNVHCIDILGAIRRPEWLQAPPFEQPKVNKARRPNGDTTVDIAIALNTGTMAERRAAFEHVNAAVEGEKAIAAWQGEVDADTWLCQHAALGETWQAIQVLHCQPLWSSCMW